MTNAKVTLEPFPARIKRCCSVLQGCERDGRNCEIHNGLTRNHLSLSSRCRHKACLSARPSGETRTRSMWS